MHIKIFRFMIQQGVIIKRYIMITLSLRMFISCAINTLFQFSVELLAFYSHLEFIFSYSISPKSGAG